MQGERDPYKLAALRHYRIRASEEAIARSLEGHWQEDVLFELQQAVERYDFCPQQIAACDQRLQAYLQDLPSRPASRRVSLRPRRLPRPRTSRSQKGNPGAASHARTSRISICSKN